MYESWEDFLDEQMNIDVCKDVKYGEMALLVHCYVFLVFHPFPLLCRKHVAVFPVDTGGFPFFYVQRKLCVHCCWQTVE